MREGEASFTVRGLVHLLGFGIKERALRTGGKQLKGVGDRKILRLGSINLASKAPVWLERYRFLR